MSSESGIVFFDTRSGLYRHEDLEKRFWMIRLDYRRSEDEKSENMKGYQVL